jgi:large subunit ribosomal protein L4
MPTKKDTRSKHQVVGKEKLEIKKEKDVKFVTNKSTSQTNGMSIPVYSIAGRSSGKMILPKEIFGQKVNKKLLAQAMRVYLTNQKGHFGSTKTRGEVRGSTAKIYRQKGTGRARQGSVRAPHRVGGGIVFGPAYRKTRLDLPQKMKKSALLSAFSAKAADQNIVALQGLEKASGKTKEMVNLVSTVISHQPSEKKQKIVRALIVTGEKMDNVVRAVRNLPNVAVFPTNLINAYEVLKHDFLLLTKDAIKQLGRKGKDP